MGFKETRLYSILTFTCPRCHEGKLFVHSNPYRLKEASTMRQECSVCGEDFNREPGFYFGAAYVSYGLTVALWIAVYVALVTFNSLGWIDFYIWDDPLVLLITGIVVLLVLLPVLVRLSRAIWINLFVHYRPGARLGNSDRSDQVKD